MTRNRRQPDTLLREIQDAAAGSKVPVTELLRKAQILAARLDHQPLKDWIRWELDGYPDEDSLPEYRRLGRVMVKGHFQGAFGSGLQNAQIAEASFSGEDEWVRENWFRHDFYEGVASLEAILESSDQTFQVPWPADLLALYGRQMYEGMVCMQAMKVISRGSIVHVLDAVRNKLLAFSLEIEREAPDAGEAAPGEHPVPEEKLTQIFNTNIYGGQATVAAGNRDVVQRPIQTQLQINWNELEAELHGLGLGTDETAELRSALESDAAITPPGQLGPATQGWLGKITQKVAAGSLTLASGVTTDMVAALVLKALGVG